MPDYQTIRGISTFEYEEKRSRFIASAAFADTEEAALAHLNRIKAANRTARHNVYAYVLQNGRTRYSDDGEPAKTAGTPVLETIGHAVDSSAIISLWGWRPSTVLFSLRRNAMASRFSLPP